jgi:hypothetical protein
VSAASTQVREHGLRSLLLCSAVIVALLGLAAWASAQDETSDSLPRVVRAANDRFRDVRIAEREGYAPIPCVSGIEGGAMGIHYVNAALIEDDAVEIGKPEAVMYEPGPDGQLRLIAVEYITTKGPAELRGHLFSFTGSPNRYGLPAFYELHVWAWKRNPAGPFADMNAHVSCAHYLRH